MCAQAASAHQRYNFKRVLSRIMQVCGRREQASSCAAFVNSAFCLAHADSASTSLEMSCCDVQAVYVRACESVLVCPCLSCVEMPRTVCARGSRARGAVSHVYGTRAEYYITATCLVTCKA